MNIMTIILFSLFAVLFFAYHWIRIYKNWKSSRQAKTESPESQSHETPEPPKKNKRMAKFMAFPDQAMMMKKDDGHILKRAPGKPKLFTGRRFKVEKNTAVIKGNRYIHGNHICLCRGYLKSGQVLMECGKTSMPKNLKVQNLVA